MSEFVNKLCRLVRDRLLLDTLYDLLVKATRFNTPVLRSTYTVFVGQKHRMLYYKRLKKRYLPQCAAQRPWEAAPKTPNPGVVWFCWLQGLQNAPPLVQRCHQSLVRHLGHKTIQVIDEGNLASYIQLPDYIMQKWRDGIIPPAHFSDLVRLEVLARYGGYWVDATVFFTDAGLVAKTDKLPLFMYSFNYFGFNPEIMRLNNWFIASTTNNNILCLTQQLLYRYWQRENRVVNYFIFHLFCTIATEFYEEEYRQMPMVSQVDSHTLASYIFDAYEREKYEILKLGCGIHKLSTRFDPQQMQTPGTFYQALIQDKLQ